jgi:hypothetical protein
LSCLSEPDTGEEKGISFSPPYQGFRKNINKNKEKKVKKMEKADIKKGEQIVNRLAQIKTLELFRVGCDEMNFNILQKLPMTAKDIEEEIGLSPMPTNKRINELMNVGLVYREKRGEEIKQTNLTKEFIDYINSIKKEVINNMANLI